ncbi:copper transporter [Pseudohyphozyma bogoriensis]|nr:copper transporter [Pseudohyphozyma bogoriensis]
MEHAGHHMSMAASEAMEMGMDGGMGMRCKMSMLWNVDPMYHCLVFPSLQITSKASLVFYVCFLIFLSSFFEYSRLLLSHNAKLLRLSLRSQIYAQTLPGPGRSQSPLPALPGARRASSIAAGDGEGEGLLRRGAGIGGNGVVTLPFWRQMKRSLHYAFNVALSFYIMLIIMSYNAVLISAVVFGAFLGHFLFTRNVDLGADAEDGAKGLSCH